MIWQLKLERALELWLRYQSDATPAGMRKADMAHRVLSALLAQKQ